MSNIKLCRNCVYSRSRENDYELRCFNPEVNGDDAWALSAQAEYAGTSCRSERERVWFTPCGKKGKQYEERHVNPIAAELDRLQSGSAGVGCDGS